MSDEERIEDRIEMPGKVITDLRALPALQTLRETSLDLSQREKILEVIRSHCSDETVLNDADVFVWAAEISSDAEDYYSTRMDPDTTLKNYVQDAIQGVSFMNSHRTMEFPLARSFAGVLQESEGTTKCYAAFYTISDLDLTGVKTSDVIRGIRAGIIKDVSVGFKKGKDFVMRCSLCGIDYRSYDCSHLPGMKYRVWDDEEEVWRDSRMVLTIIDGRLAEVSGVYDGATPNSMIEKAVELAKRGLINQKELPALERQLRMRLPERVRSIALETVPDSEYESRSVENTKGENDMSEEKPKVSPSLVRAVRDLELLKENQDLVSTEDGVTRMVGEITRLRSVETQHDSFLKSEIEDAIKEGIRAQGDKFDKERYESLFKRCSLTEVRKFRADWQAEADEVLASKDGRRSVDDTDDEEKSGDAGEGAEGGSEGAEASEGDESTRSVKPSFRMPPSVFGG